MTRRDAGVLTGLHGLGLVLLALAGFRMVLNRDLWHLLDTRLLAGDPLGCLKVLHSQPPGMNALLALAVKLEAWTGLAPESTGRVLYALLGLGALLCTFDVVLRLSGSRRAAWVAAGILLTHPAVHLFQHFFFYELLLYALMALATWLAVRLLQEGETRWLAALTGTLAATCWTRSLYHPIWALGGMALVLALERRVAGPRPVRPRAVAVGALLVAVSAWPVKNHLVFGRAVNSSWTGYNLTNGLPIDPDPDLARFFFEGRVSTRLAGELMTRGWHHPALTLIDKSDGNKIRNWNHAVFLLIDEGLREKGWAWRRENPGTWLKIAAAQYLMGTRADFVHPYTQRIRVFRGSVYPLYAKLYRGLVFLDLRGLVEAITPGWWLHDFARVQVGGADQDRPVPYTLFGLLLLPGLFLWGAVELWRRRGEWGAREASLALCLAATAWPLAVACLTDGQEGNRMRFAVTVPMVVAGCVLGSGRSESGD